MKKIRLAAICLTILLLCLLLGQAQDEQRTMLRRKLTAQIEKIVTGHAGVMGVAIKDQTSGEEILFNEKSALPDRQFNQDSDSDRVA